MLTPELTNQVRRMAMAYARLESGSRTSDYDQGPMSRPAEFPRLGVDRHRVYTGTGPAGTFNHHSQLVKFKDHYYFCWSNAEANEDQPGQSTMLSVSEDGKNWGAARRLVSGDKASRLLRWTSGLYADEERITLYTVSWYAAPDPLVPGKYRFSTGRSRLDVHVSPDGEQWQSTEGIAGHGVLMFEGPRRTREGRLLAGGTSAGQPVALFWKAEDPAGSPEIVQIPNPTGLGLFPYGEASWYQTPDGRILMWMRDEARSLRLFVAVSEDGGRSWSEAMLSDFPDSTARVRAGNLKDGRCYLIGNSLARLMDRKRLMLSVSDDGLKFDRMYLLLDDPTAQRAFGWHKVHGYQYPISIEEEKRLVIGYSVNKEDIESGIIEIDKIL